MNRRWKGTAAALAAALALHMPAAASSIRIDETTLTPEEGWVENGTSYITLRAYAQLTDYDLNWDGQRARLSGDSLELEAQPGQAYITANQRPIYVDGGVQAVDGKLVLPLRTLAQATGALLSWDSETNTAQLHTSDTLPSSANYNEEDLYWLSRVISAESRGEPLLGQIAVGNVVLNRVTSHEFPNTIREVVFDRKNGVQFEPVSNGTIHDTPTESAVLAAKLCLEGASVVEDCLYFFAPSLSKGTWITQNRAYFTTIGCHRFYR